MKSTLTIKKKKRKEEERKAHLWYPFTPRAQDMYRTRKKEKKQRKRNGRDGRDDGHVTGIRYLLLLQAWLRIGLRMPKVLKNSP